LGVLCFEIQDHADSGEVEPALEQVTDVAQAVQVIGAVAAGSTVGALRLQ
jgi:hypothetical protein